MSKQVTSACACRDIHYGCDKATCTQAKYAKGGGTVRPLKEYRRCATEEGCQTCSIIVNALSIPQIKSAWQASIAPALQSNDDEVIWALAEDQNEIGIEIETPKRMTGGWFLRTRASGTSQHWRHFDLWIDPATAPENKSCKAFIPRSCHPVERTDSPEALEHLKEWLRKCNGVHSCRPNDDTELPARLVKVTDNQVKVVDTEGQKGRYTTLSHRWGIGETFKLTTGNATKMNDNIPWDSIPRTYQDAIKVTRGLGVDYIWIDSLCIIQDNLEDWKRESIRMRTVYGHSYLNIAACHALDSNGGLFSSSPLPQLFPALPVPGSTGVYIRNQPHMTHADYGSNYWSDSQPLLGRGWVLQERLLSPRVVYYDGEELKWECGAAKDCQCGGMVVISNFKSDYTAALLEQGGSPAPLPFAWMRIAERYSHLRLTYDADRAVALAGIAGQALKSGRGGRYLAGVWERGLAHQLCWEISDTHRKPRPEEGVPYLAPSWSWLSVFGRVHYSNRMDFDMDASAIAVDITEAECTAAAQTDQTGVVTGGFLKVNGRGVELLARIDGADLGSKTKPPGYRLAHAETGVELGGMFRADYVMSEARARAVRNVFVLFWGVMFPDQSTFLVLRQVPGDERRFERLGIWWFKSRGQHGEVELLLDLCKMEKDVVII
ncbi:heterokaryon incompatibility protein-domain-containing protein [Hypoxylon sp. FL1150]|nr:heterokaryon incompatibility protein-domain-containing protein [Hypoxylon sp. FL1150]